MTRLSSILAAILLTFSGLALADTAPIWKIVQKGDSPQIFAKRYDLTTAELIGLNPDLTRRPKRLIPGEPLNVNAQTDSSLRPAYRWVFTGGDPAGPSLIKLYHDGRDEQVLKQIANRLAKQIPLFTGVPEDVRERFRSQLEWAAPRIEYVRSTVDTPLVLHGLIFGGYRSDSVGGRLVKSKVKYWNGTVICLWQQPEQLAALYDPVSTPEGISYQLVAFLECQNAAVIRRELPPEPVVVMPPPETTYVAPPVPEPPPPLPPPLPPVLPSVEEEPRSRDYYADYVAWLTDEYVRLDEHRNDQSMNHVFIGHEFTGWTSGAKRLGLRVRNAEALFDMKARSGDHNAGLVVVFSRRLRLDIEAGLGYSAIQRLYYEYRHPDQSTWTWAEKRRTTDGFGPYVRTQWILPDIYADLKWRDHGVIENLGGYLTIRPGWFYAKAAYDLQLRPTARRHVDGQTITFVADTMTMNEGRLGVSFSPRFLAYGSYQHWEYSAANYWFTRFGPGGGFEWYPFASPAWRIDGNVIRFKNLDQLRIQTDRGPIDVYSRNREWRLKLGIVYAIDPW